MKKLLYILLVGSLVGGMYAAKPRACAPSPNCGDIDDITVSVGDTFYIDRPESGGIGCSWKASVSPKHTGYVQNLGSIKLAQAGKRKMGGTTSRRFNFKAIRSLQPGALAIRFTRYYRGNAEETCDVMVNIED